MSIKYTAASSVGRRLTQEDRWFAEEFPTGTLFAVMDGHGGFTCVDKVRKLISLCWLSHDTEELKTDVEKRLQLFFASLASQTEDLDTGCTLSVVFITKDESKAYIAILGDSPVYVQSGGSLLVSPEHNVRTNLAERQAVIDRGGSYTAGYAFADYHGAGLQMSRALGDSQLKKILNRVPEIFSVNLVPDCYILLTTDGVLDPGHSSEENYMLKELIDIADSPESDANTIIAYADYIDTGDNSTAVLVRITKE